MIRTEICAMLGAKYPIVQAPMGPYDTKELAIAVTNAGGFGMVSHPEPSAEQIQKVVSGGDVTEAFRSVNEKLKSTLVEVKSKADGHFGVNLRVAPEQPEVPELLDMIIEMRNSDPELREKLVLLVTSAGDPSQPHLQKIKQNKMKWFHVVPTVYHAKKAEKNGVDGLVATGYEAGGHVTFFPVHTMVLVPAVVEAVDVPVVAGGGFCDGRGLIAALALGAKAIYMGTRFIATLESDFSMPSKEAITSSAERFGKENATLVTQGFFGPLRHLRNAFSEKLDQMVKAEAPQLEILKYELEGSMKAFGPEGDVVNGALWSGQVAIRLKDIPKVSDLIERIMSEAEETLKSMCLLSA